VEAISIMMHRGHRRDLPRSPDTTPDAGRTPPGRDPGRLPDARRTPPGRPPDAVKPAFQCVRTHWIRGFMAFRLARRT